jgi:hypothetical protein
MKVYSVLLALLAGYGISLGAAAQQPTPAVRTTTFIARDGARTRRVQPVKVVVKHATAAQKPSKSSHPAIPLATHSSRALTIPFHASVHKPAGSGPPPAGVAPSQNFGSATVGGQPVVMTLTFPTPESDATLSFSTVQGLDFAVQSSTCSASQCSAQVAFTPLYPGLLFDSVTVLDIDNNVLDQVFVYGTGLAPQFGYELGGLTEYIGFVGNPAGVAIGPDENYYLADPVAQTVTKFARDFSSSTTLPLQNVGVLAGVAVDGAGTVYVADQTNDVVVSYTTAGVQSTVSTSTLLSPTGLAVDGSGALYIADTMNGRIIKIDNQGNETTLETGLNAPQGVAVDSSGDLFFDDLGNGGEVQELVASSGSTISLGQNLGQMQGIAVDAGGRVYYTTSAILGIISPNFSSSTTYGDSNGTDGPYGVAVDQNGDVFTTQTIDGNFSITNRASANFILSVPVGQTTSDGLTVSNTGNTPLSFSNQTVDLPQFSIDPSSVCTTQTVLQAGQACDVTIDFTPPEDISYTGTYTGTSNSLNAAGSANPFTLYGYGEALATATNLSASSNSLTAGRTVLFTASVSPTTETDEPAPTGSMQFLDGTTVLGMSNLDSGTNHAEFSTSTLAAGPHSITAVYSGDTVYATSTSTAQTVTVAAGAASTSTSFTLSSVSITAGQPETIMVSIQGAASPALTGTVTLSDQNGFLASTAVSATSTGGTASFTLTNLTVGSHQITASYGGDANYAASASAAQTVAVAAIATTTTLAISSASIPATQSETLTATIQGGTGSDAPTGSVTFSDQNGALGSGTLSTGDNGLTSASLTLTNLSVGAHQITANFPGDTNNLTSTSAPQTVTVTAIPTTLTLTASAPAISSGQNETLVATVQGATNPAETGNVTFSDQFGVLGAATVTPTSTGSTASITISFLSVGSHQVTAVYSGDTHFATSTGGPVTVTVNGSANSTATTLTLAPATVSYESPVALTAAVTIPSGGSVGVGQVIFCDASASICNPVLSLATAQLTSNGTATVHLPPGTIGTHSYTAIFLGQTELLASTSAAQTVTVTGAYSSSTTIASSGSAGNYTLTGMVAGLGSPTLAPTGSVTFTDATNTANPTLGTAPLGTPTLAYTAVQPSGSPVAAGAGAYGVATGDFNGDGKLDVVLENYSAGTLSVLLGNGDGTFQPQVTYAVGTDPERVLVADFNGDGIPDIVVANTGSNTLGILLGNGDGTFKPQVTYAASSPVGLGVMDLNHDGIADLIASNYYSNTVSVLLGNGDGTFQSAVTYATGSTPQTLAEGDFNGDGNVDLAVGNLNNNTVGIFLGKGDGTFQAQVTYPVGSQPQGVQVGDFNGDGLEDLAVSNSGDGTVGILLGKGDGSFQPQVAYPVGATPVGLVIADFNGDGKQDISVGNTAQSSLSQSILLGNGDGTFQPQLTFPTGNFPYGAAAGDFNGDGFPDLAISNFNDATATILLSQVTQTAAASLTGVALGQPAGTHNVSASYPGGATFGPSQSSSIPLLSNTLAASAAALTISPSTQVIGQSVLFSVSVAGTTQTAPSPTGNVTLTNTAVSPAALIGSITLGASGSGTFSTSSLPVGSYSITATYGGDGIYAASTSAAQPLTISKAPTATTLSPSAATLTVGQTETLTAIIQGATSPAETGMVAFADQNGPLGSMTVTPTSTGSTAVLSLPNLSVGTHRITASYGGDANFASSASSAQTVTVSLVSQTITFAPIPNHNVGDPPFTLSATASSGLPVTFAVLSGPATLSGNVVTLTGPGNVTIQASQAGNNTYAAAPSVSQAFTVAPLTSQTITFAPIPNHNVNDAPFTLSATASSGLPVTFAVLSGPATLAGNVVTLTGSGSVTIQASQAGNSTYAAAPSVSQTFTVSLVSQTITFATIPTHSVSDPPFTLSATASSGLPVTFTVTSGPATLAGNVLTLTGPGSVTIQASQAGNTTYAAAPTVSHTFTVTPLIPTLVSVSPAAGVVGAGATTVVLTGTNFSTSDTVLLNGAVIASKFTSTTTLSATLPASFFASAATGQIAVYDPVSNTTTSAVSFVVTPTPSIVFTGPSSSTSGQQPTLTFQLVNPYPFPLTGNISLVFTPSGTPALDDPAVVFSVGGRTLPLSIPANSTSTPTVQIQTGTLAGTVTLTLTLTVNGVNVTPPTITPVVIAIPASVPTLISPTVARSGQTLTVALTGFSNTREVSKAIFHFTPVPGGSLNNPDVTVDVTASFAAWFANAASDAYGSQFTYTQPFTLDVDASVVQSVTVTLVNTVGNSVATATQ